MKKLYRSRKNKMILGICAGVGDYFRIDPFLIRLTVACMALVTAILPVLLAYFICAFIIPKEPVGYRPKPYKRVYRSSKDRMIAGVCGGLSEFFKYDSSWVRIIFVVILILSGIVPMLVTYVVLWIFIPKKPYNDPSIEIDAN